MEDKITKNIIVKAGVEKVFNAWSNFENFPYFMKNIKSVSILGGDVSEWKMIGPLGVDIEWEAETTMVEPYKRIGWNTKDRKEGNLVTSGQVSFNQLNAEETEVVASVHYKTDAGVLGEVVARVFSDPEAQLEEDLRNFKAYIEAQPSKHQM